MKITCKITFLLVRILCSFGIFVFTSVQAQRNIDALMASLPFPMEKVKDPIFPDKIFKITDFGAVGDGRTLNTEAFAKAIEACSLAGGGTVDVPSGAWLTGPIEFRSNINLHLNRGALVIFSPNHADYPLMRHPANKSIMVKSPIWGYNLENIAITGEGVMDGNGDTWRPWKKDKTTDGQWNDLVKSGGVVANEKMWWPSKAAMDGEAYIKKLNPDSMKLYPESVFEPARDFLRPYMVMFYNCKRVLLDGPTFQNSPKFVLYPNLCEDVIFRNIKVLNEWWAQNGDAIDISGGRNVMIYNCFVNAGDDGICMKSSKNKKYNDKGEPVLKNVVIFDCVVYHAHGGFVIGSNTDGGMQNIYVTNCNFMSTDVGIRIKSARGRGSVVENIYLSDIFMKGIDKQAILFDTYYAEAGEKETDSKEYAVNDKTPIFKNFRLNNITCTGAERAIEITGLPEMPVQDIEMKNISISADKGLFANKSKNIRFSNVYIAPKIGSVFTISGSSDYQISKAGFPSGLKSFVQIEDSETNNIVVSETKLDTFSTPIEYAKDAKKEAVVIK